MMMNWNKLNEMKKILFIVSAIFLISVGYFSCSKENTEDYQNPFSDNIIGRWNLVEVSVRENDALPYPTDYSKENIIFDFQENNKLVVTGPIPDVIAVFDDFKAGEHFYEYIKQNICPTCKPGPNLFIDKLALGSWERIYFCIVPLDEKTMKIQIIDKVIGGVIDENGWLSGGESYSFEKKFIKLNDL